MKTILLTLAALAGSIALQSQPHTLPEMFVNGAERRGTPVIEVRSDEFFAGLEWDCAPKSKRVDETCWAGLSENGFVTGP